jgi:hypothetical protein
MLMALFLLCDESSYVTECCYHCHSHILILGMHNFFQMNSSSDTEQLDEVMSKCDSNDCICCFGINE